MFCTWAITLRIVLTESVPNLDLNVCSQWAPMFILKIFSIQCQNTDQIDKFEILHKSRRKWNSISNICLFLKFFQIPNCHILNHKFKRTFAQGGFQDLDLAVFHPEQMVGQTFAAKLNLMTKNQHLVFKLQVNLGRLPQKFHLLDILQSLSHGHRPHF